MRAPSDLPSRRPRAPRIRVGVVVVVAVLFALLLSLRGVAGFYTDYLWFDSLHLAKVWRTILGAKVALAVIFSVLFFAVAWGNLAIADRIAPRFRPAGPEEELVARYREIVGNRTGLVRIITAALLGLIAGIPTSAQWNDWLLFANKQTFGREDPLFHKDIGYYVFQLPFLKFLVDWAFASIVIILLLTAVAHYLNGGIRIQVPAIQRVTPQVKAHLSVLLGVLAILKALGYWLQRYELTYSTRGVVDGANYTDVKAQLPALYLLIAISLFAAGLFVYNIRQRGWVLPVIGVGLWAFTSIVVGGLVPAFVQKFTVEPNEVTKEQKYIARNIEATRFALGLEKVKVNNFAYQPTLTSSDLADNAATVRNARLWDPTIIDQDYEQQQALRSFYAFKDVDVDRYEVDGQLTQVLLSARELDPTGVPSKSWINEHLNFTHGYAAVANASNAVDPSGLPVYLTSDLPPTTEHFDWKQPAIYFGQDVGGYAIVRTKQQETDFQTDKGTVRTTYKGTGGVTMSSWVRRAALALRFGDINPLISSVITPKSRAIYIRDIDARVRKVAPFLKFDADPYPVILNGRVTWVQDAYTTTSRFPYSQRADTGRLPGGSGLNTRFNYVRNSVKVAIDAYDGNMTFYVVDKTDPIIKAYQDAFPKLFTTKAAPKALADHFRFPEDQFRIQTDALTRYHIQDARDFYDQGDAWDIARDPGSGAVRTATDQSTSSPSTTVASAGTVTTTRAKEMDPYYLLMRLPEEQSESFLILQPFTPLKKDLLSAFAVAKSDGNFEVFVMPRDESVPGPRQIDAAINQERAISSEITLLSGKGSTVLQGNLVLIPVNQGLLYIRPLYVQAESNPVPELKLVVVVQNGRVEAAPTLQEALTRLFGAAPPTLEQGGGTTTPPTGGGQPPTTQPPSTSADVQALLRQAEDAFGRADAALRSGDLKGYADAIAEARGFIDRAQQASGGGAGAGAGGAGAGAGGSSSGSAPPSTTSTTSPAAA